MHVSPLKTCDTFCGSFLSSIWNQICDDNFPAFIILFNQTFCISKHEKGWWFLLITVWFFVFRHLNTLNVAFMVVNLHKFFAVKARIVVTNVWLVRINVILFAANQTFSVLLTETHFLFVFIYFVIRIAVLTVEISLAVFAVKGLKSGQPPFWERVR